MAGLTLLNAETAGTALDAGYSRLKWARDSYGKMTMEYAGRYYGAKPKGRKRPVNLLAQYVHTIIPNLLNQRPSHIVRSRLAALRGEATLLGMALDLLWTDMGMVDRIHALILDALLSPIAVAKIGLRAGPDVCKVGERGIMLGQPYVCRVSPDDYAADPAARSIEELCWEAHRYRIPKQYALDCGIYDADTINRLQPLSKETKGENDDRSGVEDASGSGGGDPERFSAQDYIELWDVAIRNEDQWLIGTLANQSELNTRAWINIDGEPIEFEGDAAGPYEHLNFHRVPDNLAALSPGMTWLDVHEAVDKIYNKMIQQALRTKRNFAYNRTAHDDALTLGAAPDGEGVAVDDVNTLKPIDIGGVVGDFYPMIDSLTGMFNASAGNMQLLSGSGVQSDKATGQQILQANAQTRLGFMKDRVWRFINALDRRLGGYLVTDPLIKLPLPYRLPGGEMVDVTYDAATRRGDAAQFTFESDMATMVGRDPEIAMKRKLEALQVMEGLIPAAQAGIINLQALARQVGREVGWTDMDEVFNDVENQQMLGAAIGPIPTAAPGGAGQPGQPGAIPPGGPEAGVGQMPNRRAGMVRSAYGTGAEMQGAVA